jgi:hypothetical protein
MFNLPASFNRKTRIIFQMRTFRLAIILAMAGLLAACAQAASTPAQPAARVVSLYYYNPDLDLGESGNMLCSPAGLVAVERNLDPSLSGEALIQQTIELLIAGELTADERAAGITTEFPLGDFSLEDVALDEGTVTMTFSDPNLQSSGGACRVGVLWAQIEATTQQFPEVTEVRFAPEELFQP